ncbi:MAG: succinylglutamate desuccinylase/aspartoacylase family protein [Planctomycetota bacterium]
MSEIPVSPWRGQDLPPGSVTDLEIPISESYVGIHVRIPVRVIRGLQAGPTVGVTAALHGDEINGTGAIRDLAADPDLKLIRGTLILVPVLNVLAFDRHSRYLPDRRDLNRCFPGSPEGSSAARVAHQIFTELVPRCDAIIDLHTAAVRRTNYPNVRGNLSNPEIAAIAKAFGCEVIVDCEGVPGTLRREATRRGCPTIILEGGEVWKVEPGIVDLAARGIKNVLKHFEMIAGTAEIPDRTVIAKQTRWVRATRGGFLRFHVHPGALVTEGQLLATNTDLLGNELGRMESPFDGVLIGMTTIPSIAPGGPVCHIARLPRATAPEDLEEVRGDGDTLENRLVEDLASNVRVEEGD